MFEGKVMGSGLRRKTQKMHLLKTPPSQKALKHSDLYFGDKMEEDKNLQQANIGNFCSQNIVIFATFASCN